MSLEFKRVLHQAEVAKKSGNSPTESESSFVVPNGQRLRIERFSGGIEYTKKEARVELLWRDGGDEVIAVGYYGSGFQYVVADDRTGNGTAAVVIRLVNGDSSALNMAGWWEGVLR